jgi:hypothetical protein
MMTNDRGRGGTGPRKDGKTVGRIQKSDAAGGKGSAKIRST